MPTRYLKPGVRDSGRIEGLSEKPDAEILYYRLLVSVDDFGRTDARPLMIKALCFPIRLRATADKCMQWLTALADVGLIHLYEVDSKPYLQIAKWDNKPRAAFSKYPQPPSDVYSCPQMLPANRELKPKPITETSTVVHANPPEPKNGNAVAYIPIAGDKEFVVTQEFVDTLEAAYPAVDVPLTLREIRAWCISNPARRKTARGVKRFLNAWCSKEQNNGP